MSATPEPKKLKSPSYAEPILWGMIGAVGTLLLALFTALAREPSTMAAPAGGGFFTGWLAAHLWNWSGGRKRP